MIASVSGVVKAITLNSAVIEVGGVGILISLPARFAASLAVGKHVVVLRGHDVDPKSRAVGFLFGFPYFSTVYAAKGFID